ncbi:tyrosine-type recombinase/integrase [Pseudonocardia alni]|uniref:tyrosine-type recombinase/integrase n=1 Tax=Pseudonocardia alni TaxID=33907 RepID=UPI003319F299
MAANTTTAYRRQWGRFSVWCAEQDRTALPATAETLTEYVVAMSDIGLGASTIGQAISAIRTVHRIGGHDAPSGEGARLALRAHRRDRADAGHRARQAPPITITALRSMIDATDPSTAIGARDRLLLVLGLAMMGRRSELAALLFSDVVETADGLEIHVRRSKRDQDARGAVVAVPRGQHADTDPVRLLAAWREALAEQGVAAEGHVLRSVTRHGRVGASISPAAINNAVRAAAIRAALPGAEDFTAHSLRAGGATSAYRAGAPVSAIASHGRWAPNSPVVLGYIRSVDRWADNPMKGVGL